MALPLPLEQALRDSTEKLIETLRESREADMTSRVEWQNVNSRLDVFGEQWNAFLLAQVGRDARQVMRDEKIAEHLVEIRNALGTNGSGGTKHG